MSGESFGLSIVLSFFLVSFILWALYLLTMHKALSRIAPENRKTSPAVIWLTLVPLAWYVTHFMMVEGMTQSLANEYRARNLPLPDDRPGYSIGLTGGVRIHP